MTEVMTAAIMSDFLDRSLQIQELSLQDPERAHVEEDSLHMDALFFIANNATTLLEAREVAALARITATIPFPRWAA
jgi:hypothetical protein